MYDGVYFHPLYRSHEERANCMKEFYTKYLKGLRRLLKRCTHLEDFENHMLFVVTLYVQSIPCRISQPVESSHCKI